MLEKQKLKIFVLGHKPKCFESIGDKDHLEKINLNDLILPIDNSNELAENRFYLLNEDYFAECPEYVGTLTWQHNTKYPHLLCLENLDVLAEKCHPNLIWASSPTETFYEGKWIEWSNQYHKTIDKYLQELAEYTCIPLQNNPTFWANNFICHKSVFLDFIRFFKNVFQFFHQKYGYNFALQVDDSSRTAAYFYERVSMLYFSSRSDLTILQIPQKPKFDFSDVLWIASAAENYKQLTKIWEDSLHAIGVKNSNIVLNETIVPSDMDLQINFQSDIWYYAITKKLENLISTLEKNKMNKKFKYFISTDCDIHFFADRLDIWRTLFDYIEKTNFDIYFNHENNIEINSGFFIIKKNKLKRSLKFLKYVLKKMHQAKRDDMPYADQTIMRKYAHKIDVCILPSATCVAGPFYNPKNKRIYLYHHAICAYNLEMKLLQIEYIKKIHDLQ